MAQPIKLDGEIILNLIGHNHNALNLLDINIRDTTIT